MLAFAIAALAACGGGTPSSTTTPTTPPNPDEGPTTSPTPVTGTSPTPTVSPTPSVQNAPEITKSPGVAGGVVILWPRVAVKDAESQALAAKIQQRLRTIVAQALPGKPIDVRPEPERVCGKQGCTAIAVGASLMKSGGGCAVIATVSNAGQSPATMVPWIGAVNLKSPTVPFREPPESALQVVDFENCGKVEASLGNNEAQIEAALKAAR